MPSEPLILAVETATLSGSIAIAKGAEVIGGINGDPGVSHSNTLLTDLDRLLVETGTTLADVDLFAVAAGPGSFTGLRIGIATVKALAATLERPCAAVPTLEAVALASGVSEGTVALLPAGRGEVFAQLFSASDNGEVTALDDASHIPPQRMIEKYGSRDKLVWGGEGALAQRELIERYAGQRLWRIAPPITNLAIHVAALALAFKQRELIAPEALRAIYVRPSDAELKL